MLSLVFNNNTIFKTFYIFTQVYTPASENLTYVSPSMRSRQWGCVTCVRTPIKGLDVT